MEKKYSVYNSNDSTINALYLKTLYQIIYILQSKILNLNQQDEMKKFKMEINEDKEFSLKLNQLYIRMKFVENIGNYYPKCSYALKEISTHLQIKSPKNIYKVDPLMNLNCNMKCNSREVTKGNFTIDFMKSPTTNDNINPSDVHQFLSKTPLHPLKVKIHKLDYIKILDKRINNNYSIIKNKANSVLDPSFQILNVNDQSLLENSFHNKNKSVIEKKCSKIQQLCDHIDEECFKIYNPDNNAVSNKKVSEIELKERSQDIKGPFENCSELLSLSNFETAKDKRRFSALIHNKILNSIFDLERINFSKRQLNL